MIVKTQDFEGPFDLLLHLIRTNEMEIEAISVLEIIDSYVSVVAETSLAERSDFVLMASGLIAMKARYLNRGRIDEPTDIKDDPLEQLVEKLRVYRRIKELGEYLKLRESTEYHYLREPEVREAVEEDRYSLGLLTMALQRVIDNLSRFDDARQEFFRLKRRNYVSVRERQRFIMKLLTTTKRLAFGDLCETKEDLVATFLALLELLKGGEIQVLQEEVFSEIYIVAASERGIRQGKADA